MKLKELTLENFKSFKDETKLENLKDFTVLIGQNNAGKSNVIKALEFLNMISRNDTPSSKEYLFDKSGTFFLSVILELSFDERKSIITTMKQIDHLFSNLDLEKSYLFKTIKFEVGFNDNGQVAENFFITNNRGDLIQLVKGEFKGQFMISVIELQNLIKGSASLDFPQAEFPNYRGLHTPHGILNNLDQGPIMEHIAELLRTFFRRIKFIPVYRNLGVASPASETREFDARSGNAPQVLNTYLQNETEEFVAMTNELKGCLPKIEKISAPLSGSAVTLRISEPNLKTPTNIDDFSDGVKQTFSLFLLNRTTAPNRLICIEEPEINLHSDTQKKLFSLFRENKNDIQYIITTHSPTFTAIGDDCKTFLLTKPNGSSQLREIIEKDDLKFIKQELGIKNSDIYGYDGILFVEGYSEEEAAKIIAPAIGHDEIGSSIRLVNLEGVGKVTRLRPFLEYLKNSDSKIFLLVDNHKEIHTEIPKFKEAGLVSDEQFVIWDQDFEDTFTSKELIDAMNKICVRNNYKFTLTVDQLENERTSKSVIPVIKKNFFELNSRELNKPELAKELAYLTVIDILNNKNHKETKFESVLRQAMKQLQQLN